MRKVVPLGAVKVVPFDAGQARADGVAVEADELEIVENELEAVEDELLVGEVDDDEALLKVRETVTELLPVAAATSFPPQTPLLIWSAPTELLR